MRQTMITDSVALLFLVHCALPHPLVGNNTSPPPSPPSPPPPPQSVSNLIATLQSLATQATELVTEAEHVLTDHRNHSRGHLLSALEFEVSQVELLEQDLNQAVAKSVHHITNQSIACIVELERQLAGHETLLADEVRFVELVYRNYNSTGKGTSELIEFGSRLVAEARTALTAHTGHPPTTDDSATVKLIRSEVSQVERLVHNLQHNVFPHATHLEEIILVRIERTLHNAIDRLNSHGQG